MLPKVQSSLQDLNTVQSLWAAQIDPLLGLPLSSALILKSIALKNGLNQIDHKLGRKLIGWFIVRRRGPSDIWDSQDSNQNSNLSLLLNSSAAVTVDLAVF